LKCQSSTSSARSERNTRAGTERMTNRLGKRKGEDDQKERYGQQRDGFAGVRVKIGKVTKDILAESANETSASRGRQAFRDRPVSESASRWREATAKSRKPSQYATVSDSLNDLNYDGFSRPETK
jgi:hypothetical protein